MRLGFKFSAYLYFVLIFLIPFSSEAQLATDEDFAWISFIYYSDSIYLYRLSDYEQLSAIQVTAPADCKIVDDGVGGIAVDPSTGDTWAVIEFDGACTSFDDTGCNYRKLAKIDLLTGIVDTNSIICPKSADPNVTYIISFQFTSTGKLITYNYDRWLHEVDKNTGDQLFEYGQLEDSGPGSIIFDPADDNVLWHHDDGDVGLIKYSLPDLTAVDSIKMPEIFSNIMWYDNPENGITGPAGQNAIYDSLYVYDINSQSIMTLAAPDSTRSWYPRQNHLYFQSTIQIAFQDDLASSDPLNCTQGTFEYLHDTLEITYTSPIPNLDIVLSGISGLYIGSCGSLVEAPNGTKVPEIGKTGVTKVPEIGKTGVYKLPVWRRAGGNPISMMVTPSGGVPVPFGVSIPTLGEWGTICLLLLLAIFGSVAFMKSAKKVY